MCKISDLLLKRVRTVSPFVRNDYGKHVITPIDGKWLKQLLLG